jgi:hypothetical protein
LPLSSIPSLKSWSTAWSWEKLSSSSCFLLSKGGKHCFEFLCAEWKCCFVFVGPTQYCHFTLRMTPMQSHDSSYSNDCQMTDLDLTVTI